jgi:hypothetical protein
MNMEGKDNAPESADTKPVNKGGKPLRFKPEDFDRKIKAYLKLCEQADKLPHISGVCAHMGISRQCYWEYESREGYGDVLKKARSFLENALMDKLLKDKGNPTKYIYAAKALYRLWDHDIQGLKVSGSITIKSGIPEPAAPSQDKLKTSTKSDNKGG